MTSSNDKQLNASLEENVKQSLSILSKLVLQSEGVTAEDEDIALDCFIKLFTKVPLSDHANILSYVVDLLTSSSSEEVIPVKCKLCDTLTKLVLGEEPGIREKFGKWKEIITNELVSENVDAFKTIQIYIQTKVSDLSLNNMKITSCINLIATILDQNAYLMINFHDQYGLDKLYLQLQDNVEMNNDVAKSLLQMLTVSNSKNCILNQRVITMEGVATILIDLLPAFDDTGQRLVCETLRVMCASVLQNRLICCNIGLISTIFNLLKEFHHQLSADIKDCLISIMEILGCLSISPSELKLLIGLFNNKMNQFSHTDRLVQSLERMASQNAQINMQYQPSCFIDFYNIYKPTSIACPTIHRWNGKGITIHTWVCFDFTLPNNLESRNTKVRHVLYSFLNTLGEGFEGFFSQDGFLILGVYTKKEFLTTTVTSSPFNDQEWHALTVVHTKKLLGKATVNVYVDGMEIHSANLQYPTLAKEICHSSIGLGVKSNASFHYQIHPPSQTSFRVMRDPLFPECIPAGQQNQIWGNPCSLKGQMASFILFNESLMLDRIKELVTPGPNYQHLFTSKEYLNGNVKYNDTANLSSSIVFYYNAKAARFDNVTDLSSVVKDKSSTQQNLHAKIQRISSIQETIQALGGVTVLFPLLEQACFKPTKPKVSDKEVAIAEEAIDETAQNIACQESPDSVEENHHARENPDNVENHDIGENPDVVENHDIGENRDEKQIHKVIDSDVISENIPADKVISSLENSSTSNNNNIEVANEIPDEINKVYDVTDGGQKKPVLSSLPVVYSPRKPENAEGDWTESIEEELSLVEIPDERSDGGSPSINTYMKPSSIASPIPRNDAVKKDSSIADWTLLESAMPRTNSEIFKNWVKQDNHDLNGVAHFISLIRHMIASRKQVQDLSLEKEGIKVIGLLLQDCDAGLINIGFLDSLAQFVESLVDIKDELLEAVYTFMLFDFQIWHRADISVQIAHVQLLHTYIKDDQEYFNQLFGIDYFFRVIEQFYISYAGINDQENRTNHLSEMHKRDLRTALLGLIFFILKLSPTADNCRYIMNYVASVTKHEHLSEVLDYVLNVNKKSSAWNCIHQIIESGCYIMYRWLVYDIPDKLRRQILDLFVQALQHNKLNDELRQKIMLKNDLFPAIGELLCKQSVSREVIVSLLKLALSIERTRELEMDIYTDFSIVLSIVRISELAPRPIKLEVAIKIRNSMKLCHISAHRCADQPGWYAPILNLLLKENSSLSDIDVMEAELVHVIVEILQMVIWHGIDGSDQFIWTRRCEPLCCLHEMSSRHTFLLPSLVIERLLYESCLEASATSLVESMQPYAVDLQNAVQLLKLIEDFLVGKEVFGLETQKWSLKLVRSIFDLLKAMNAWEDSTEGGSEWLEVLQIVERILYQAFSLSNKDILEAASYRLTQLLHRRVVRDQSEACYQLFHVTKVVYTLQNYDISCENVLSVILQRLENFSADFIDKGYLSKLPSLNKPGDFARDFIVYMRDSEYQVFLDHIENMSKDFERQLCSQTPLNAGRLWMNALTDMTSYIQNHQSKLENSLLEFSKTIYCDFDERRNEEITGISDCKKNYRQKKVTLRKLWLYQKRFLTSERGAWSNCLSSIRHFKLSNTENRYRMRLKLTENLKFNSHVDASRQRDKSHLPDVEQKEMQDKLLLVDVNTSADESGVFSDNDEDMEQENTSHLYELTSFDGSTGSFVYSCDCHLITLMDVITGRIELSTTHIYFYDQQTESDGGGGETSYDFRFPLEEVREIYSRRFNLRKTAMEFFLLDRSSFFVNFTSTKDKEIFYKKVTSKKPRNLYYSGIQNPLRLLKASNLTNKWVNREISNFEYLMQLNTISGRTYNDLAQYPVFPWVLTEYTTDTIDLNDPSIYRDLSKPIGALNPVKAEEIKKRYEQYNDDSGLTKRSHYFTHYSNPGGVLHYLLRVEPFTSLHIELQGGNFDWADRQFYSISTTWNALMKGGDVKELTPEFFFFPEFLLNMNSFNLGNLQRTGESIDDVTLPPWCKDAYDFINIHSQALESEYVSAHLNEWIDLIFGYKQRGDEAEKSLNVFSHYTYEGAVDLDKIEDPLLREATEGMINNFGQTPTQLLKKAHPKRKTLKEIDSGKPKVINQIETSFDPSFSLIEILHMSTPVVFIATCKPRLRSILYQAIPDSFVTVHSNGLFGTHSWLPYADSKTNSFTFTMDVLLASTSSHTQRALPGLISPSVDYSSKLFACTSDGHLMISCGYWDNTIRIINTDRGRDKLKAFVDYHNDIVTCISLDVDGSHMISGSADFTCAIWRVEQSNGFSSNLSKKPTQILYGHDSCITTVAMYGDLDMAVSGAKDGTCLVHTLRKGVFAHCLKPFHPQFNNLKCEAVQIKLTDLGRIVVLSKVANWENALYFMSVYSVNGALLGNINLNQQIVLDFCMVKDHIVIGCLDGTLQMRHVNNLGDVVLSKKVHAPVFTVAATHNGSHIFIGRGDGNILVVCPSFCT